MKKTLILTLAILTLGANTALANFPDISDYKENLFNKSINWLKEQGVVQGYPDGTFRPGNTINRAEFLKMLYETIGMQNQNPTLPFPDVPSSEWYTKYIKEAYATGIVQGYPDGSFRPGNPINLAEALKIVMEGFLNVNELYGDGTKYDACAGIPLNTYPSVDSSTWYWRYIHVADELCILKYDLSPKVWEYSGGDSVPNLVDFNPGTHITRADMAALLYIAKAVKDNGTKPYNEYSMFPKDITRNSNEIAFDSCGALNKYENKSWFNDLEIKYAAGDYMENSVGAPYGEGCLSLDKTLFIFIPSDFAQAEGCGRIFKYDIVNNTLEEALGDYCAVEFSSRIGNYVQFSGFQNDGGSPCKEYNGKYYFEENSIEVSISSC